MSKVVFLDRDGTINEEVNYLHRPEELKFLDGVPEAIKLLKDNGFKIIVVTNQAGVARGYYTCKDVEDLHSFMNEELEKTGTGIDAFYYCPHHPTEGTGEYRVKCDCRKPGTGLFKRAEEDFDVDKAHSYMIGDNIIDIEAGVNYGVPSILVGTGYGKKFKEEAPYDFYAETLMDAAGYIIARENGESKIGE